ncbi:hypothetical protein, partial [Vibrio mediterranei]|uniref:hypothetical protein n=1 Tax=Vibrio mediterranei TaxID=689 RepID=UPI0040676ED4
GSSPAGGATLKKTASKDAVFLHLMLSSFASLLSQTWAAPYESRRGSRFKKDVMQDAVFSRLTHLNVATSILSS